MIILDTNVISETLRPNGDPKVRDWLNRRPEEHLFTTAVNMTELFAGVEILPDGRRRTELALLIEREVIPLFQGRCLAFDLGAARAYAAIYSDMQKRGRAIGVPDCQIAAIAKSHGFAVATRDVQPFIDAGVNVIDPWADE